VNDTHTAQITAENVNRGHLSVRAGTRLTTRCINRAEVQWRARVLA
jgi:hypothetical protein